MMEFSLRNRFGNGQGSRMNPDPEAPTRWRGGGGGLACCGAEMPRTPAPPVPCPWEGREPGLSPGVVMLLVIGDILIDGRLAVKGF